MSSIEERVQKLEKAVFGPGSEPGRDDWQKTVGMFRGDAAMKKLIDDVRDARETERDKARELDRTGE
jgi:hypothetical protein